jgi:hypothetical protein
MSMDLSTDSTSRVRRSAACGLCVDARLLCNANIQPPLPPPFRRAEMGEECNIILNANCCFHLNLCSPSPIRVLPNGGGGAPRLHNPHLFLAQSIQLINETVNRPVRRRLHLPHETVCLLRQSCKGRVDRGLETLLQCQHALRQWTCARCGLCLGAGKSYFRPSVRDSAVRWRSQIINFIFHWHSGEGSFLCMI